MPHNLTSVLPPRVGGVWVSGRVSKQKQTSNEHGRQRRSYQRREAAQRGEGRVQIRVYFLLGPVSRVHQLLKRRLLGSAFKHFLFRSPCQLGRFFICLSIAAIRSTNSQIVATFSSRPLFFLHFVRAGCNLYVFTLKSNPKSVSFLRTLAFGLRSSHYLVI